MSNLLIVDDDVATRILISELLGGYELNIFEAGNGKDAIKIIRNQKDSISLVLLDIFLPDSSGFEVIKKIKVELPDVPVLAITAVAIDEVEKKCRKFGFKAFFPKPLDLGSLKFTILDYCNKQEISTSLKN